MLQLKLSTYNSHLLTAEDRSQSVTLTVSQHPLSPWMFGWGKAANSQTQNSSYLEFTPSSFLHPNGNNSVKILHLPVPADGVIPFQVELSENVAMLTIEVMRYKCDSWHLHDISTFYFLTESFQWAFHNTLSDCQHMLQVRLIQIIIVWN